MEVQFRNILEKIVVYTGMAMFTFPLPYVSYLDEIRPEKPPIVTEYQCLQPRLDYLQLRHFSLEEALNPEVINEHMSAMNNLSDRINEIETSDYYLLLLEYNQTLSQHRKKYILPLVSGFIGILNMFLAPFWISKPRLVKSQISPKNY